MISQSWLLPFNEEVKVLIRKVITQEGKISADDLWRIGHYEIPLTSAQSLTKCLRSRTEDLPPDFRYVRLGLVHTETVSYLAESMLAVGLKHGLIIMAEAVKFSDAFAMVSNNENLFKDSNQDYVMITSSLNQLSSQLSPNNDFRKLLDGLYKQIELIAKWCEKNLKATPILGLNAAGVFEMQNSADILLPWSETAFRKSLNDALSQLALNNTWPIWNIDQLATEIGLEKWRNDKQYFWAKLPFDLKHVMYVADSLGRIIAAACGKTRRALVLDLDNTLWGGVVGDDGIANLKIGEGSAAAEAYLSVQQLSLNLKKRGVLLAVCSKNEESIARKPFIELQDMALKENDISIFQANWDDKATNIKAIAEALNLTTSSLAFLDDNPAERARVRQMLPDVAVIEIGDDPSNFARTTMKSGYFEHLLLTEEDIKRTAIYSKNIHKIAEINEVGSYEDYLSSLKMTLDARLFDEHGRQRISQLTNKSNQYNLTSRRYSIQEITEIENSNIRLGLQFRLFDRFGDNGMISVVIINKLGDVWEIDTWLMSCRVLKRGVEQLVLKVLVDLAKKSGVKQLLGCYIPTSKNKMVENHYSLLGFIEVKRSDIDTWWKLDVNKYEEKTSTIKLELNIK